MKTLRARLIRRAADEDGAVLITVLAFALIIVAVGLAFLSAGSGEARNSHERYASERAFWLAESGIERFASESWADATWPMNHTYAVIGGTVGDTLGGNEYRYDLMIRDTTIAGINPPAVPYRLISWGTTDVPGIGRNSVRQLDVAAYVVSAIWDSFVVWTEGDVTYHSTSSFDDTDGKVHADGEIDEPNSSDQPDDWSENTNIDPPAMYTEPDSLGTAANTSYYYVQCFTNGGRDSAKVLDWNHVEIDPARRFGDISKSGSTWSFNNVQDTDFSWGGTRFPLESGRTSVIINFGEDQIANVNFAGGNGVSVQSTIINTRYKSGAPPTYAGRIDNANWEGGAVDLKNNLHFEPVNGLAFVAYDLKQSTGGSATLIGTDAYPALVYLTNDLQRFAGDVTFYGTILCLGNADIYGTANLNFDPDFIARLPGNLSDAFQSGPSLAVNLLSWREIPRQ